MGHGSDSATRRSQPGFRTKRSRSTAEGGGFRKSPATEFAAYPDAIHGFHERLAGVVIENRQATDLIHQFDSPTTLIYADPPYVLSSRTLMRGSANSAHGYRHEMLDDDHRALAECLRKCRSMVVLSGYASDLYDRELYPDWQRFERKAVAEAGKARTEVVWLNPACSAALIGQHAVDRMTAQSPPPLTPSDCDLRDFPFMPLDVVRLRDSDITALSSGDEFRCAVLLWCASWHQVPAASLPDDDIVLSQLAGFGRVVKEWKKVREGALRGWVKCSDGRLYHPVVAEKAGEALEGRMAYRQRKEEKRAKKKAATEQQTGAGNPAENALIGTVDSG